MVRARHHFFLYPFFRVYSRFSLHRNFHEIKVIGECKDHNLPVLAISNHFSWWDGIFASYLNLKIFKRRFYFMVHETLINKYWFFKYIGAFSVNKNSISLIDTFTYTKELLTDQNNMVLVFPQGEIRSLLSSEIKFEKGIEKLISIVENEVQIVFIVNLVDYFSNPKPTLYTYLKEIKLKGSGTSEIQNTFNGFYRECVNSHKSMVDRL